MSMQSVKEIARAWSRSLTAGNGQPADRLADQVHKPDPAVCPDCHDLGYVVPDLEFGDPGFGRVIPCHCQEAVIAQALWKKSGLELEEQSWRLEFITGKAGKEGALVAVQMLISQGRGWVVLYGNYGMGKSGLLKSAVATLIRSGQAAYYRRAEDILAEARATFGANDNKEESDYLIREKYATADFLAIDEVDRFNVMSEWAQNFLFALLDRRYNRRSSTATILATNQNVMEMPEPWGYLQSRMSDGLIVAVAGENLRDRP